MQLPDDFLHGVAVLVGQPIECTGARAWARNLRVGEVQQAAVASVGDDLILICSTQCAVSAEQAHISP